jgi:1,4-dihydroxy-2-naphthoyl-CoA hydrolase
MFAYSRTIRLKDTDATGLLYFAQQLHLAMEAFEEFLSSRGSPLSSLMTSAYLLPVVHAESDYKAPLRVGDLIEVSIRGIVLGDSSVTVDYGFARAGEEVGTARLVHVLVDKATGRSTAIPPQLRQIFI